MRAPRFRHSRIIALVPRSIAQSHLEVTDLESILVIENVSNRIDADTRWITSSGIVLNIQLRRMASRFFTNEIEQPLHRCVLSVRGHTQRLACRVDQCAFAVLHAKQQAGIQTSGLWNEAIARVMKSEFIGVRPALAPLRFGAGELAERVRASLGSVLLS